MRFMVPYTITLKLLVSLMLFGLFVAASKGYISATGDLGMRRDGPRVATEPWNQCNKVHEEAPRMGSPREADSFDVYNSASQRFDEHLAGKSSWPELVGLTAEEAERKIHEERPHLKIHVVQPGVYITMDYRSGRVRIFLGGNGKVASPPVIG